MLRIRTWDSEESSFASAGLHLGSAYRAVGLLLLVPLLASHALVVPFDDFLDPRHAHRAIGDPEDGCHVLDGVVVGPDRPVQIDRQGDYGHVRGGQSVGVPALRRSSPDLFKGCFRAVGHPDHVAPQGGYRLFQFIGRRLAQIPEGIDPEQAAFLRRCAQKAVDTFKQPSAE